MEDAQETSLGPSEPLGAGVREEVKALPAVQGPPAGWGGGSLFGLACVCVCVDRGIRGALRGDALQLAGPMGPAQESRPSWTDRVGSQEHADDGHVSAPKVRT